MWEFIKYLVYDLLLILAIASAVMIVGTCLTFIFDMFLVLIGV